MSHYAVTLCSRYLLHHRVHRVATATFWRTLENLAQPGEGGRRTPTPFHYISTITYIVVVYATAERADKLPSFLLYPYMYSTLSCKYSPSNLPPDRNAMYVPTALHASVCVIFFCVPLLNYPLYLQYVYAPDPFVYAA